MITRIDGKVAITGNCWLRQYASKDYNIEKYLAKKPVTYDDPFVTKVVEQLTHIQDKLDYKDLTLTDYLNVNLGLSFDEGYPKISEDDDSSFFCIISAPSCILIF